MNLQADIKKITSELERRDDPKLIKLIHSILELEEKGAEEDVSDAMGKRLVDQALRAEEDIKAGRFVSIEEARSRFDKKYGT